MTTLWHFDNSSMLSIYQNFFKKAMIETIYCVASFQTNIKKVSDEGCMENFRRSTAEIY